MANKGFTLRGHDTIAAFFGAQGLKVPGAKKPDPLTPYRELAVAIHVLLKTDDLERAALILHQRIEVPRLALDAYREAAAAVVKEHRGKRINTATHDASIEALKSAYALDSQTKL